MKVDELMVKRVAEKRGVKMFLQDWGRWCGEEPNRD